MGRPVLAVVRNPNVVPANGVPLTLCRIQVPAGEAFHPREVGVLGDGLITYQIIIGEGVTVNCTPAAGVAYPLSGEVRGQTECTIKVVGNGISAPDAYISGEMKGAIP